MKRDGSAVCVFAIYDCPRDYPNHVVIRAWQAGPDKTLIPWDEPTLFDVATMGHRSAMAAARQRCRRLGLDFLPRTKGDDPVIVEKWKGQPREIESEVQSEHVGAVLKTSAIKFATQTDNLLLRQFTDLISGPAQAGAPPVVPDAFAEVCPERDGRKR